MSCCRGNRVAAAPARRGIAGYVSRLGEDAGVEPGVASPALGAAGFGKMVGAGVTIWAITRMLDRAFSRRGK